MSIFILIVKVNTTRRSSGRSISAAGRVSLLDGVNELKLLPRRM